MLINVSTRRFGRAVRLPEGDISAAKGTGVSKSAVSRRFVALSAERMAEWMAADLSELDLLIIQIDGIQIEEDLTLLAAIGIDGDGSKHPLGVIEGATENAAVAQALLDNLIGRGLDPKSAACSSSTGPRRCPRRSAGPSAATRRSSAARFTKPATLPSALPNPCTPACARRCGRRGNSMMPKKAEKLIRNLARRLEHEAPGVSASILEGIDEILTVTRLGYWFGYALLARVHQRHREHERHHPAGLPQRQTLAGCQKLAPRWTGAAMLEAAKGFRRLKARKQLPICGRH